MVKSEMPVLHMDRAPVNRYRIHNGTVIGKEGLVLMHVPSRERIEDIWSEFCPESHIELSGIDSVTNGFFLEIAQGYALPYQKELFLNALQAECRVANIG